MTPHTPAYGRRQSRGYELWAEQSSLSPYAGQTYYERPAIKPSHYGWLISSYLFIGGLAGASQIIAAIADLFGGRNDRGLVRGARFLGLLGALVSPVFLIMDLHTPKRWHHMLRIFRRTSPMSIGSWTLAAFGTFSGAAVVGQLVHDRLGWGLGHWLARVSGIPAAAAGMVMSCYTGSLLSATSVPLWAAVHRVLPPLFGTSAMSTGAAAASLAMSHSGSTEDAHHALEKVALAASASELALAIVCERQWRVHGLEPITRNGKFAWFWRVGVLNLGILLPLIIHAVHVLTGRRAAWASMLADFSALAGGFIQRALLVSAGNDSAARPRDYFEFTQPMNGRSSRPVA
jgi:formate-dependent nitrite reductase membrane component NrfD